jgi:hypothetical protein
MKRGRRLLCANLADPAPADAASGRGPVAAGVVGMSVGHEPSPIARDRGLAATSVAGMLARHELLPIARGGDATPTAAHGLSIGHGLLCATRSRGPTDAATPGLSAKHGPLRAARGRNPAAAAELWWTCGPNSPSYHAPSGEGMPDCSFLTSVSDSTHELVALERSKSMECKCLVLEILYECFGQ